MGTTLTKSILDEFVETRKVFVETGTFNGDGVELAIEYGFESIYSIELSYMHYAYNREKFMDNMAVNVLNGDSVDVLPEILSSIQVPTVFWFDAHYGNTWASGKELVPLISELKLVCNHYLIRDHLLIIDDVRLFGVNFWENITLEEVEKCFPSNYVSCLRDSNNFPDDIMVVRFK
jgi:hypothetical protein